MNNNKDRDSEKMKLGRIMAVIQGSESCITGATTRTEKINAVITAYEHIVKILQEEEK